MNDKKKIIIVGGLVVVMLGVGAFQFLQPAPAPAPTADSGKKSSDTKTASLETGTGEATKETTTAKEGEPGKVDETAKSGDPAVKEGDATVDPNKPLILDAKGHPVAGGINPGGTLVASRDPFDGRKWTNQVLVQSDIKQPVAQQPVQPQAPRERRSRPRSMGGQGFAQVPPFDPTGVGVLPTGTGTPGTGEITPNGTGTAQAKLPNYDDVPYQVSGVVSGKRQAAIFKDASGGQRLVKVGDTLDGDTQVVGIKRGQVIVSKGGKTKVLSMENDKKGESGGSNKVVPK